MNRKQKWYNWEKIIANFLIKKWFKIINKNYTIRWWEIDLIAEKNWVIHFVEVKQSDIINNFQEYITKSKISALKRAAQKRIASNKWDWAYQFDLALISNNNIDYIENFLD